MSDNRFTSLPVKAGAHELPRSSGRSNRTSEGDDTPVVVGHVFSNKGTSVIRDPSTLSEALMLDVAMLSGIVSSCRAYLTRFTGRTDSGELSIWTARGRERRGQARWAVL